MGGTRKLTWIAAILLVFCFYVAPVSAAVWKDQTKISGKCSAYCVKARCDVAECGKETAGGNCAKLLCVTHWGTNKCGGYLLHKDYKPDKSQSTSTKCPCTIS